MRGQVPQMHTSGAAEDFLVAMPYACATMADIDMLL